MSRQKGRVDILRKESLSLVFWFTWECLYFFKRVEILEKDCRGIKKKENVAVLDIEHGYSIFSTKKKLKQS